MCGNQTNLQSKLKNNQSILKKQTTLENTNHLEKEPIAPFEEGFEISLAF